MRKRLLIISLLILVTGVFFSLKIGALELSIWDIVMNSSSVSEQEKEIFYNIRLPRLVVTLIIGANMALSGYFIQSLTKNPMASPSVLGINAGATLFVIFAITYIPQFNQTLLALFGFTGAAVAATVIFIVNNYLKGEQSIVYIALIGIVIQTFFSSGTQTLMLINEDDINQIIYWLSGSLAGSNWTKVILLAPLSLIGIAISLPLNKKLEILQLGDQLSVGLGLKIKSIKLLVISIVVLLCGISVSVVGPIGFVGLITPHIVRYSKVRGYVQILIFSAIFGSALLIWSDIISRLLYFPKEIPVGVVTAVIGAPYFVYLVRKHLKQRGHVYE
ncbi:MAG: FecCD family ABC transporter permease [Jeotgalicoccus sp.]